MKIFLTSLALTAFVGMWMVSVASSQLDVPDQSGTMDTVSGAYSNPVNRALKQGRLDRGGAGPLKSTVGQKGAFCEIGGFDRACKFKIAGLKISPPLAFTN